MSRARVLHLLSYETFGGAQEHIRVLAKYADRGRFDLWVGAPLGGSFAQVMAQEGCHLWDFRIKDRFDLGAILRLARFLRQNRVDILHTHVRLADLVGALAGRLARTPVVLTTIHDRIHLDERGVRRRGFNSQVYNFLLRHFFHAVIAVSEATRQDTIEQTGLSPQKVYHIINGTDLERLHIAANPGQKRAELGFEAEDRLIGNVARLKGWRSLKKGHEDLLQAATLVLARELRAHLLIVGDGEAQPYLEEVAQNLGLSQRVHFLGFRRDALEIMACLDIFVLSSHWEGLPRTLMEAMGLGVPCVATAVDGVPELAGGEEGALLVPPQDPPALAQGILRLLGDQALARKLADEGQKRVWEHYDGRLMAQQTEALYLRLLAAKGRLPQ